ncbi:O-antigen ligase family protein [Acanthopleuribacter pedis]|uniref:O-antigen ligase family protein n=1 Tax=Acanthopleuribacter pedis TaxID=442870 RepID=A0A8J7Q8X6_9BACT|nr:O-antigen ligase family protein [Acanthopleuribacter pedis]MBO1320070.1 O-antigen ligase family protein [Acanthopleuribacter pedis]
MTPSPQPSRFAPTMVLTVLAAVLVPHDFGGVYAVLKGALWLAALSLVIGTRARTMVTPRQVLAAGVLAWPWLAARYHHGAFGYHPRDGLAFLLFFAVVTGALLLRAGLDANRRRELRLGLSLAAVMGATWMVLYALIHGTAPTPPQRWGLAGTWGNPNLAAHFLIAALCLGRWPTGLRGAGLQAWLLVAISISGSRAALLAGVVYVAQHLRHKLPPSRPPRLLALIFALGLIASGIWLATPRGRQLATYAFNPAVYLAELQKQPPLIADREPDFQGKTYSFFVRLVLWQQAPALIGQNPWFGAGPGQYRVIYPRFSTGPDPNCSDTYRPHHAHHLWIEAAVMFGIPWTLCLTALIVHAWLRRPDPAWRTAVLLQAGIALVSLNYLNSFLVALLILTAPSASPLAQTAGRSRTLGPLMAILLSAVALVSLPKVQRTLADRVAGDTHWFVEEQARAAAARGDALTAWRLQRAVLFQDPFGPTPRHNLAVTWEHLAGENGGAARCAATALFQANARRFPFYQASQTDLFRLESAPGSSCPTLRESDWIAWLQRTGPVRPEHGFSPRTGNEPQAP